MALSRELINSLNSDEEPLRKRLKLAQNAFCKADLPITRKEDLVLQWLCKLCLMGQDVWSTLHCCLKYEHLNIKYDIKELLVNVLIQKLSQDTEIACDELLQCCGLLLRNPGMHQYLANKPEDFGLLIKALLRYIFKIFKREFCLKKDTLNRIDIKVLESDGGSLSVAYNTAITIAENVLQIYQNSVNSQDELRTIFVHDILYSLCIIIDHKCQDSTNRLRDAAYRCLQHIVFGKTKNIQEEIKNADSSNGDLFGGLFSTLGNSTKKTSLQTNIVTFVFVFQAAIDFYKSNYEIIDFIFRKMINFAGRYKKEILNSFFPFLNNILLDFDRKIDGESLSEYLVKLIDEILLNETLTAPDYIALTGFSYLNPLLIETKIPDILKKTLLQEHTMENTDLLIAILDATMRLRRSQKLISHLLATLQECALAGTDVPEVFPKKFKNKLTECIDSTSNLQAAAIIKTLMFHLENCSQSLLPNAKCNNVLMLKGTIELHNAILDGLHVFEYSGVLLTHKKILESLSQLGDIISSLVDKALHLSHNKDIIVILLSAVLSWSEVHDMLNYYVPNAVERNIPFLIPEDQWQQLIQRITNFGEDECKNSMNKLILHRLKRTLTKKSTIKLNSLIGGTAYFWKTILMSYADITTFLTAKELSKITNLLLVDIVSNEDSFTEWSKILNTDCLQENRKFVTYLLGHALLHIGSLIPSGRTKAILQYINVSDLVHAEMGESNSVPETLESIKNEISNGEWECINHEVLDNIRLCLRVLYCTRLAALSTITRTLIYLVMYAINREYGQDEKLQRCCVDIFSDLLEQPDIDIFQYIDPVIFSSQLRHNETYPKAFEQSLKCVSSYDTLKSMINSSKNRKEDMLILLECIDNVKQNLNGERKDMYKKGEKKLCKLILNTLSEDRNQPDDIKHLTLILRIAISNKKVNETLKKIAEATLRDRFSPDTSGQEEKEVVQEDFELAVVMFQHPSDFEISNDTIQHVWNKVLKCPCSNLIPPLLTATGPKELQRVLKSLHSETVKKISEKDETSLENIFILWNGIMRIDQPSDISKTRALAVSYLFEIAQYLEIPGKAWPHFLRLFQIIFGSKHLHISGSNIDRGIHISLKALNETKISACNDVLNVCNVLLKVRSGLITDRLPAVLLLYRRIGNLIVHESSTINGKADEQVFRCLAINFEKFTTALIKFKRDMMRLSPYLIADFLELLTKGAVPPFVKACLEKCIGHLISICDQHGIALLSRTLPAAIQEVFKVQLEIYNKFHKFSGKI